MHILKSSELESYWKNLVYIPKQIRDYFLDLTVKKIFSLKTQGSLDFGGSEYQPSEIQSIKSMIEDDPQYGWWSLLKGCYMVEYNEMLQKKGQAIVYPHHRLLMTGCFHSPFIVKSSKEPSPINGMLIVGDNGIRVKENARISTALTFLID